MLKVSATFATAGLVDAYVAFPSSLFASLPLVRRQVQFSFFVEFNSFGFQHLSLQAGKDRVPAVADSSLRIHDAIPRNVRTFGKVLKHRAHLPCISGQAGKLGDLSVSGDPALRDPSNGCQKF